MAASRSIRNFRLVMWALVVLAAGVATWLYVFNPPARPLGVTGQEFIVNNSKGGAFTQDDLAGVPTLVFFGYTFCPDVCPTTLAETTAWRAQLGLTADDLRIIFVSVDPERDTIAKVKDYVEGFDETIVGLVAAGLEQNDNIKRAFGVFSEKNGEPGDEYYLVDHTAMSFLLDKDGVFKGTISYGEDSKSALGKLAMLVNG